MDKSIVFEHIEEVESTNAVLSRRLCTERIGGPVCLSTDRQTHGRGRRGRSWLNTEGALMMSVCYPLIGVLGESLPHLSLSAALGVHDALRELLPSCAIKWPNDIVVEVGTEIKKLCGILLELQSDCEGGLYAIVGIGINANCTVLPEGLMHPATSLRIQTGGCCDLEKLKKSVAFGVLARLDEQKRLLREQTEEYSRRCITLAREVIAVKLDGEIAAEGIAKSIAPDGRLIIKTASGEVPIDAADVSIRPKRRL